MSPLAGRGRVVNLYVVPVIKYELLVDLDGEIHVLGEVNDEFGVRWGPLDAQRSEEVIAEVRTILGYGADS